MEMSLAPVATPLAELIGHPVKFVSDCVGADAKARSPCLKPGDVLLLENTRFHAGEERTIRRFPPSWPSWRTSM
jgi:phosphoglycerate kinase